MHRIALLLRLDLHQFPLVFPLPLCALEWGLLLALWVWKTRALFRGGTPIPLPLGALWTFRVLPPLTLLEVEAEEVEIKVGLW
ncbi:hypothetical protein CSW17_02780 [Thermus scotoductus]|nr:hypothetical protein CSW17_02780 [Thermus scotoductus]